GDRAVVEAQAVDVQQPRPPRPIEHLPREARVGAAATHRRARLALPAAGLEIEEVLDHRGARAAALDLEAELSELAEPPPTPAELLQALPADQRLEGRCLAGPQAGALEVVTHLGLR